MKDWLFDSKNTWPRDFKSLIFCLLQSLIYEGSIFRLQKYVTFWLQKRLTFRLQVQIGNAWLKDSKKFDFSAFWLKKHSMFGSMKVYFWL